MAVTDDQQGYVVKKFTCIFKKSLQANTNENIFFCSLRFQVVFHHFHLYGNVTVLPTHSGLPRCLFPGSVCEPGRNIQCFFHYDFFLLPPLVHIQHRI